MAIVRTSKADVVWNYAGTLFGMASSFLLLPILMHFLQPELLSLWYIFLSLSTLVNLLNSGLGPSLSRNVMYAWGGADKIYPQGISEYHSEKPNYNLLFLVFDSSRLFHFIIALCALVLMLTLGSVYINHIAEAVEPSSYTLAWFVFCLAVFLNLYYDYFSVFLRGIGEIATYNKYFVISKIADIGIATALLIFGFGLTSAAISYFISGLLIRVLSKRKLNEITSTYKPAEKSRFSEVKNVFMILWPNCWRDWLVAIADALTTSATTIVCSLFLNLTDAGIYALCLQFATAIAKASDSILFAFQPQIANDYVRHNKIRCLSTLSFCMLAYSAVFIIGSLIVAFALIPLLQQVSSAYQFDMLTMALLLVYQYLINRYKLYAAIIAITNDLSYWKAFIISSIVGLGLSAGTLAILGSSTIALILPQLAIQCFYNVWKWPKIARKKLIPNATLKTELMLGLKMAKQLITLPKKR